MIGRHPAFGHCGCGGGRLLDLREHIAEALFLSGILRDGGVDGRGSAGLISRLHFCGGQRNPGVQQLRILLRRTFEHRARSIDLAHGHADDGVVRQRPGLVRIEIQYGLALLERGHQVIENDLLDVLRQHQRVASLWFFSRQWTTAFRYKYWWTHLENPHASVLVPDAFVDRLIDREWRWDFLGEREYVSTTSEDDARRYAERMAIRR
ncbi:MAG TPA: hypothetical protein VKB93_08610 [Thermoanaerobaculia bacterium]|nr:hypothetical protein [Thermoanaerobaculia bacterium]